MTPQQREYRLKEMKLIAKSRGGKCLSTEYVHSHAPLHWQCRKGHTWYAASAQVERLETWCRKCYDEGRKPSLKERQAKLKQAQRIAKRQGGECLSKEYVTCQTKLSFRCQKGHVWPARLCEAEKGGWCRKCVHELSPKQRRARLKDMQRVARRRQGKCLSTEYVNHETKLRWQCRLGHIWQASPALVEGQKKWCRKCYHISRRTKLAPRCQLCGRKTKSRCLHPGHAKKIRVCSHCVDRLKSHPGICPTCPDTRRNKTVLLRPYPGMPDKLVCGRCIHDHCFAPVGRCPACNLDKPLARTRPKTGEKICWKCGVDEGIVQGICPECPPGHPVIKRLPQNHPTDRSKGKVCNSCYLRLRRQGICPLCPVSEQVIKPLPHRNRKNTKKKEYICQRCYRQLRQSDANPAYFNICTACPPERQKQKRWLPGRHPDDRDIRVCERCRRRLLGLGVCNKCKSWAKLTQPDPVHPRKRLCESCSGNGSHSITTAVS